MMNSWRSSGSLKNEMTDHRCASLYLKIHDRVAAMEEPPLEDVDMSDPEQVAIWKTVQILLNKVIYADSYLQQEAIS